MPKRGLIGRADGIPRKSLIFQQKNFRDETSFGVLSVVSPVLFTIWVSIIIVQTPLLRRSLRHDQCIIKTMRPGQR